MLNVMGFFFQIFQIFWILLIINIGWEEEGTMKVNSV